MKEVIRTPEETLELLQEIAVLAANHISNKPVRALTVEGASLVLKLQQGGFLEVKERADGIIGNAISND